ncbi:phosphonate ABC transporter substrate-binding protein [Paenibacillus kribbensis]|uniref:phosphonate ABC transporter substrate-binding protein n=1 Tax=Paenibacillus kribbensis TaxID=172713 RepID=UPI000838B5BE|nr:phosphonate ABC transporter substrate-binding protein [Paenibacillus kribbensis]
MSIIRKALFPLLSILVIFATAGCAGQGTQNTGAAESSQQETSSYTPDKLKIGVIPSEDSENVESKMEPLKKYLSKKLGMEVDIFVANDYTAVVEAMRSKQIDVAHLGPFSYLLATEKANAEAIVSKVDADTGLPTYKSVILTRKDSGIKTISDLKGKTFAFIDPASTSGNLVPRNELLKNGVDPDKDFSTSLYAGGGDASALAVQNKKVDAGATSDTVYKAMVAKNLLPDVSILHESAPIPTSPVAVRKDLDSGLKEKIKQAYLDMDKESPESLKALGLDKYGEITDSAYDNLREIAKILNLDLTELK